MHKKFLTTFIFLLLLICAVPCLAAKQPREVKPEVPETPPVWAYIADYAVIVSDEDKEAIAAAGRPLLQQYNSRLICLTEEDLSSTTLDLYSDEVRKAWGLGERDCLIIFIRHGRKLHFGNGQELAARLTTEQLNEIVKPVAPLLAKGEFSPALRQLAEGMAYTIARSYEASLQQAPPPAEPPAPAGEDAADPEEASEEEEE